MTRHDLEIVLAEVAERVVERCAGQVTHQTALAEVRQRFHDLEAHATVHDYLPVLTERAAVASLTADLRARDADQRPGERCDDTADCATGTRAVTADAPPEPNGA